MTISMAPHGAPLPMTSRRTRSRQRAAKPNCMANALSWLKTDRFRSEDRKIAGLPGLYLGEISKFRISRKRANLRSINEPELSHAQRRRHRQVFDLCPSA